MRVQRRIYKCEYTRARIKICNHKFVLFIRINEYPWHRGRRRPRATAAAVPFDHGATLLGIRNITLFLVRRDAIVHHRCPRFFYVLSRSIVSGVCILFCSLRAEKRSTDAGKYLPTESCLRITPQLDRVNSRRTCYTSIVPCSLQQCDTPMSTECDSYFSSPNFSSKNNLTVSNHSNYTDSRYIHKTSSSEIMGTRWIIQDDQDVKFT